MIRQLKNVMAIWLITTSIAHGDERQVNCLALNAYHEARGEGIRGMQAVMDVTLNRKNHKSFPSTICGVVFQKSQFSWTASKSKITDWDTYNTAVRLAKETIAGSRKKVVGNSLYYHESSIKPKWSYKLKFKKAVGSHLFYTENNS